MTTTTTMDPTMPTEKRLARLEETVRALIKLLQQETIAVKAIDLQTFSKLQTVKNDLLDIYHDDMKPLLTHKNELKTLPDAVKERIRAFERDMSIARMENLSALERAGKSFTRLRDRIVHIARESVLRHTAQYGANGQLQTRARKAISTGVQDHA